MKTKIYYKHVTYGKFVRIVLSKDSVVNAWDIREFLIFKKPVPHTEGSHRLRDRRMVTNKHEDFQDIVKQSKRLFQKKLSVIK